MSKWILAVVSCLLVLASTQALAGGDPAAGKEKSAQCQACHGPDGNSPQPSFPKLAGQHEDYLLYTLMRYQSGKRQNPVMGGMVAALSEQDMKDLAAWYASQDGLVSIEP